MLAADLTVTKASEVLRALRNRREFYRLGQMSDLELADIGLRRGDLHAVSENPLTLDPTGRLEHYRCSAAAPRYDGKEFTRLRKCHVSRLRCSPQVCCYSRPLGKPANCPASQLAGFFLQWLKAINDCGPCRV